MPVLLALVSSVIGKVYAFPPPETKKKSPPGACKLDLFLMG